MTVITGDLILVTDRPATVTEVWIRAGEIRTHDGGLVLEDRDREPVHDGWLEINVLPGPAILTLVSHGAVRKAIPIVVPDAEATSLEDAVNAATLAQPSLKSWLEELAASILAGTKGPQGRRGPEGPAGPAPYIQNGTWWIKDIDTGIDATGPQGDPGIAPHIQGETWWVGEVDTGISARGPKGDPGDKGDPGPTGTLDLIDESVQTTINTVVVPAIEGARDEALGQVMEAADDAGFARVVVGKNLYNPAEDSVGYYVIGVGAPTPPGELVALAGYRTTDFIPVISGESYALSVARHWAFYDADRAYISDSWAQSQPQAPVVVTAPTAAAYMRMSYSVGAHTPENVQIEQGSVHTAYEPYGRTLDPIIYIPEITGLAGEISERPTVPEVQAMVGDAVESATSDVARVIPGKNLYDPNADDIDIYINDYVVAPLVGYRTTDFIPVVAGESYALSIMRHLHFYDSDKNAVQGGWSQKNPPVPVVAMAPPGAAYMRMSYPVSAAPPSTVQIEQGNVHTPYEPYGRRVLDPSIVVQSAPVAEGGPVQVTRAGDVLTVTRDLGGQPITQEVTLGMGRNSVMNFSSTQYGDMVQPLSDDVAPIRTTQGTVGANHGLLAVRRWPAGSHDKTTADLGSIWTDGTTEYAILHIDPSGHIYIGQAYTTNANGSVVSHSVNPSADLTHVSGATHTSPISRASLVADQLWPWVQRRRVVVEMDGRPVIDGSTSGRALTIRESYEILDYGAVYDWAKANVGQPYTSVHHRAAVGVETEWIFHPGGKTRHRTRLWEISPTQLGSCGFLQAITLPGAVTRYLPGVGVVGGLDWHAGVDLEQLTTSLHVTSTDLLDLRLPPTVVVDARSDVALAVAVSPWRGASQAAQRLASTPSSLWDLRSTKKIYPVVLKDIPPGWGNIEVEGIRAYLTPDEATAIVTDADPASAWVTLDQMSG